MDIIVKNTDMWLPAEHICFFFFIAVCFKNKRNALLENEKKKEKRYIQDIKNKTFMFTDENNASV